MKKALFVLALLCCVPACLAATPPAPIILPDVPPVPSPPPAPSATALGPDQFYVIRANVPVTVLASPANLVTITTDAGPIKIKGKFTDGSGKYECRTFSDKTVITVQAAATGTCEILVVPVGSTDPAAVQRRTLNVTSSPTPVPPVPQPTPADPLTTTFSSAYALDKDTDRATSLTYLQLVYAGMAKQVPASIKTNGDAFTWITSVVRAPSVGLGTTQVLNLRKAIGAELTTAFGNSTATPIDTTKLAAELTNISKSLAGVK